VTHPYPGAFTGEKGRRLFIWWAEPDEETVIPGARPGQVVRAPRGGGTAVATGKGILILKRVQREGGPEAEGHSLGETIGVTEGDALE